MLRQFAQDAGVIAAKHFDDSFRNQGFTDSSLQKWQPRKSKLDSGRAILVGKRGGRLRRSQRKRVFGLNIEITYPVPYAKAHNEGFEGTVNQQVKPFTRKNGVYVKGHSRKMKMNLPKRQFMGTSQQLNQKLSDKFNEACSQTFKF